MNKSGQIANLFAVCPAGDSAVPAQDLHRVPGLPPPALPLR